VRVSRSKLVGESTRTDVYERKSFLDPSLRAELSTSVSLSIPHLPEESHSNWGAQLSLVSEIGKGMAGVIAECPEIMSQSRRFDNSIQSISQSFPNFANSTFSCLSPTETLSPSNTLNQSFYVTTSESIPRYPSALPWRRECEYLSQGCVSYFNPDLPFRVL
jgi:hypothetical protein